MNNKSIFADNLKKYMDQYQKTRRDLAEALGVSYYTVTDWVNGKKYPRMDKVEMLANYFGVLKSDLIEEKSEEMREIQKNNDTLANIIVRLRTDESFFSAVEALYQLDPEKLSSISTLLK